MSLPGRLTVGEGFKPEVSRAVNQIIDYLKTQRITVSGSARRREYASGIVISVDAPQQTGGGGGTSYRGYFKVALVREDDTVKISIASGARKAEEAFPIAGLAVVNETVIRVPEAKITLAEGEFVIAKFELSGTTPQFVEFLQTSDLPGGGDETLSVLLATLRFPASGLPAVIQQQYGVINGWIFKDCEDETV